MRWRSSFLLTLLASFGIGVSQAATVELADLWYDPAVPGRGLSIHQQNDVVFATFYTYDATGKGIWYVASDVRSNGIDFDPCGSAGYVGRLHEARGPALGGTAPPLTVRDVGTIAIRIASVPSCPTYGRMSLQVTIDNVATNLVLVRQTWAPHPVEGRYSGSLVRASNCDFLPEVFSGLIEITRTGTRARVTIGNLPPFSCSLEGEATQAGHRLRIEGTQTCLVSDQIFIRPFVMEDLAADNNGFTSIVTYPAGPSVAACGAARIGGARRFGTPVP